MQNLHDAIYIGVPALTLFRGFVGYSLYAKCYASCSAKVERASIILSSLNIKSIHIHKFRTWVLARFGLV